MGIQSMYRSYSQIANPYHDLAQSTTSPEQAAIKAGLRSGSKVKASGQQSGNAITSTMPAMTSAPPSGAATVYPNPVGANTPSNKANAALSSGAKTVVPYDDGQEIAAGDLARPTGLASMRQKNLGAFQDKVDQNTPTQASDADLEELIASFSRRGGGPSSTGSTVGGLAGGALGSFIPGVGNFVGGMIGSTLGGVVGGAFDRQAESAPTDFGVADARQAINAAYQEYLGRPAYQAEMTSQLKAIGWDPGDQWVGEFGLGAILDAIAGSEEASNYDPNAVIPNPGTLDAPHVAGATPVTDPVIENTPIGSYSGQLAGFDNGKLQDQSHLTPKYVFGRIASKYNVSDPAQREAMLAELKAHPAGYFKNASFNKGDLVVTSDLSTLDDAFGGINTFDVVGGFANGGNNWQWNPLGGNDLAKPTTRFSGTDYTTDMAGNADWLSALLANYNPATYSGDVTSSDFTARLLKALQQQLALGGGLT